MKRRKPKNHKNCVWTIHYPGKGTFCVDCGVRIPKK